MPVVNNEINNEQREAIDTLVKLGHSIENIKPEHLSIFSSSRVGRFVEELEKSTLSVFDYDKELSAKCFDNPELINQCNFNEIRSVLTLVACNSKMSEGYIQPLMKSNIIPILLNRLNYLKNNC